MIFVTNQIRWIMLDVLNQLSFLALRPLHMRKLAPVIILFVVEAGLQPKGVEILEAKPIR
jgi:hypothetical protein